MQETIQTNAATMRPMPINLINRDQPQAKPTEHRKATASGLTREELRRIVADQID
jgi:hypothetical protein